MNLIGDHTDYTGGLVLPMAIDLGTTIEFRSGGAAIELTSDAEDSPVHVALPVTVDPAVLRPRWGTYVAAMAQEMRVTDGFNGRLTSTLPIAAGLSSSAALECAVAMALGFDGSAIELALAAQRAEHAATGVPTGIMDQLSIAAAAAGHATLIDCDTLAVTHVKVPTDIDVVVRFIAHRTLVGSAYADRVAECRRAEAALGSLRSVALADIESADLDDVARRRARHVATENQRVVEFADALEHGDYTRAGAAMLDSHHSLAADFDTSTPQMDDAVAHLAHSPGVFGARMTGGGFGGCVVAICEPGAITDGWIVRACAGARRL